MTVTESQIEIDWKWIAKVQMLIDISMYFTDS